MTGWFDSLLAGLFPCRCVLCGAAAAGLDLCMPCLEDLPWLGEACPRCSLPVQTGMPCAECLRSPPAYSGCIAALLYEYPVDRLVAAMKYGRRRDIARVLGELLAVRLQELKRSPPALKYAGESPSHCSAECIGAFPSENPSAWPEIILPVPLHTERLATRRYNQAELIARALSRDLGLPCSNAYLQRNRNTVPQTALARQARLRNLGGAFSVLQDVAAMRVAIVDDVLTTGATVTELTRVLLLAGAARVEVWAVARTAG